MGGKGKKTDLFQIDKNPSPGTYNVEIKNKNKAYIDFDKSLDSRSVEIISNKALKVGKDNKPDINT